MKAFVFAVALAAVTVAASAHTVRDLAWMAGSRTSGPVQEVWLDGGSMLLGASVVVTGGKTVEYETMRVAATPDGHVAYFATVGERPAVRFRLKSFENGRAVFENLAHDFPQRVIYWNAGNGTVGARIEGMVAGKLQGEEWTFKPAH